MHRLGFLLPLAAPLLVAAGEPQQLDITQKYDEVLEITVHYSDTCVKNVGCVWGPSDAVLDRVDEYFNQFGIDHTFVKTETYVSPDFQVYIPDDFLQFQAAFFYIKFQLLPYVSNADVVWFNTALASEGDTADMSYVGYGNPITESLITSGALFNPGGNDYYVYTEDQQVGLIVHELGHVYNLEHVGRENNLMYKKLTDNPGFVLTHKQIQTMRKHIKEEILGEESANRGQPEPVDTHGQSQLRHQHSH